MGQGNKMAPPPNAAAMAGQVKGDKPLTMPSMTVNKGFSTLGSYPTSMAPKAPMPAMPASVGMAPPAMSRDRPMPAPGSVGAGMGFTPDSPAGPPRPMMPPSIGMSPATPGVGPLVNPGPRPAPAPAPAADPLAGSRYARAAGTQWESRARQAVAGGRR